MNINDLMLKFRLASRELFNNYFRVINPYENDGDAWLMQEMFSSVEEVLFQKLVCEPLSLSCQAYKYNQPNILVKLYLTDQLKVMVNREISSGYWDYGVTKISSDTKMTFIDFFDWEYICFRDNQYVEVLIVNCPQYPEIEGKHALLEAGSVVFDLT